MKKFKVGVQLFSVRDKMAEDMDATLKAVKEAGYDYVEFAGFFDKPAEEVRALLDKYGLECVSVHLNAKMFLEDMEGWTKYLKVIGAKYYAIPHYELQEYVDNWDGTIAKFKKIAKALSDNGIQLLYHNHDFEFMKVDGEYIIDKLYKEIPEMNPEFDVCWVRYAKENPSEYLRKYNGRIKVVHFKDFKCEKLGGGPVYELIGKVDTKQQREDNGFKFRPVGEGMQNWDEIISACNDVDADIVIVEQDSCYDEDSLNCITRSREFLKSKGL